jgi:acetyltransferase-like isoleucine patch superfamily enzyme
VVGKDFSFGQRSVLWAPRSLVIGNDVAIGSDVRIEVDGSIGDGVLIANAVGIVGKTDHAVTEVGVTVRRGRWVGDCPETLSAPVRIGSDVWVGFGAILLSGVRIGDSSIVGAGSVVTQDIPENSIAVGNPAKVIGQRFGADDFLSHWVLLSENGTRRT